METEFYICDFCKSKFKPSRRKIQKFCSATCRSKNHHHKKKVIKDNKVEVATETLKKPSKLKVEQMSVAGVANAATGTLLADGLTKIIKEFQPEENKPATKKDINEIKNLINTRYFKVHNMDQRHDGAIPYFDMATSTIVYFPNPNYHNPTASII